MNGGNAARPDKADNTMKRTEIPSNGATHPATHGLDTPGNPVGPDKTGGLP